MASTFTAQEADAQALCLCDLGPGRSWPINAEGPLVIERAFVRAAGLLH